VFCRYCLSKWKRQCQSRQYDCPNCRQKVGRQPITPNLYLENLITSWTSALGPELLEERERAEREREGERVMLATYEYGVTPDCPVEQEKEDEEAEAAKKACSQSGRRGGRGRRRGGGQGIRAFLQQQPQQQQSSSDE